ncbi:MAG: flagellar protein FlbB [Spirochaetaceae bacterium]|nr:flagellar protein FlbB [Spirochaetaceae bacterium]
MARGKGLGKTIVLLFLVVILILIGLMWFDYLGVVNAKKIFAPVYKLFGLVPQTSVSITNNDPVLMSNLEDDRIEKRLEALEIRAQELDKREEELKKLEEQNLQISQELDDLRKSQEEREKTFNNTVKKYDDREVNIVQNAKNLTGMPPESAVAILNAMEDQDVIDTLRKVEEIAQEEGTMSMVSYWLSLMPADRVATIQRKMVSKPKTLE